MVRKQTADGQELIDFWLGIMRAKRRALALRLEASKLLADRGWGRAAPSDAELVPAPEYVVVNIIAPGGLSKPVAGERLPQQAPGHPDRLAPYRA